MSSGSSGSVPGEQELKECLEEAGLYEENMSYKEMLSCYKVIRSSKSTAQQEDEQRSILETAEENCKLLEELKEKNANLTISKLPSTSNNTQKEQDTDTEEEEEVVVDTLVIKASKVDETIAGAMTDKKTEAKTKDVFHDFFDCPPLKHKPLDIIYHEPKYNVPIYTDPEVLKMPLETRTTLIYNYHHTILDEFYKLHRKSLNPAPWGEPIREDAHFNNASLDRKTISNTEENEIKELSNNQESLSSSTEIYTSRAGRQTKRKVYIEEDEKLKKSKKDDDSDYELTQSKHPVKRPLLSKLSQTEIMKRSKLFADSSPKTSRGDAIFNQLVEDDRKKRQSQKAMDNFRSRLRTDSDDDFEGETEHNSQGSPEEVEVRPQPMTFLKRKTSTSVQGRRSIKATTPKRGRGGKSSKTNSAQSKSQEISVDDNPDIFLLDEAESCGEGKARCPICSDFFSLEIIEEHASSCGLGMDTESNFENVPRNNQETIKCAICNKEMLYNLDYENHRKDCVARTASGKH